MEVLCGVLGHMAERRGELDGGHGPEERAIEWAERRNAPSVAEQLLSPDGPCVILSADIGPVEAGHEGQGGGGGQEWADIAGALPVEFTYESLPEVVADDIWVDIGLAVGTYPEEGGALWGAGPFVEVTGVVSGVDGGDVEIDHAGGVGAIDEDIDALGGTGGDDLEDGEDQSGGGGDVVDEEQSGAAGKLGEDGVDDLLLVVDGSGDVDFAVDGGGSVGDEAHGLSDGVVDVGGGEDFVAGVESKGAQDGVNGFGGVCDESEVIWGHAEMLADGCLGGCQEALAGACENLDGFSFDSLSPLGLLIEDAFGDSAEGAVVEEGDVFLNKPMRA